MMRRVPEADRRGGAGDGRDAAGQSGGYPCCDALLALTAALSSFYLPELAALHSSELVVHAVLNKTDLEGTLTRSDVMKVVKPFFPDAEVFLTNKNNRNSVRSVFRGMLGMAQNEMCAVGVVGDAVESVGVLVVSDWVFVMKECVLVIDGGFCL